jgi:hypothetical protein
MEGLVTLAEVKSGDADIMDLLKLNALLDMKAALERKAMNDAQQKQSTS